MWSERASNVIRLVAVGVVCIPSLVNAQTPPAATPAVAQYTLTGNVTLVSDYRFRGISQTYAGPAFQGGFDVSHTSGLYLGNWDSNVTSLVYSGGSGVEMDF